MLEKEKKNVLLVVLYKQSIVESNTIISYCENCKKVHKDTLLYIWDNSPMVLDNNFDFFKNTDIEFKYKHTPENTPLSSVYNIVKKECYDKEILFLFDQDSVIDNDYFEKTLKAVKENIDVALFMPYVKHYEKIVSPGQFFFYKGKYLKTLTPGRQRSRNMIGITSGMAIVIDKIRFDFDENLKLYGIDTKFCLDYSDYFNHLFVIDYNLKHSLSKFEKEEKNVKLFRLKSELQAMRYVTRSRSFAGYIVCCLATYIHLVVFKIKHFHN